jgi:hypothetical protein
MFCYPFGQLFLGALLTWFSAATRGVSSSLLMFVDTNIMIHYLCMDISFMQIIDQMLICTCSWIIMIICQHLNGFDSIDM